MSLMVTPSLDIIFGPMYSGKTTEMMRRLITYYNIKMSVLYINSALDTRSERKFSTHNQTIGDIPFNSIKTNRLSDVNVSEYDVIAVDEAQFFDDLKDQVLAWVEKLGKIVVVGGLNGDFMRCPFGQLNDLIPYADSITKLTPFCSNCIKKKVANAAHFSKRIVIEDSKVLIGGSEMYIPVCRQCYLA